MFALMLHAKKTSQGEGPKALQEDKNKPKLPSLVRFPDWLQALRENMSDVSIRNYYRKKNR